jgi:flagellin
MARTPKNKKKEFKMAYRINTNISALNAQVASNANSQELGKSLSRLSSGLRINTAADDAAGMTIADSLRSQSNTLGQSVKNANDAIGIVQIADKAMDEQLKILNTIKTKAAQSAQDGQSSDSRQALQSDITKLMEELDNISNTTSYNGLNLLSGSFTQKQFQIGGYSRETISVNIGDTTSAKIGATRFETSNTLTASVAATSSVKITNLNGSTTTIAGAVISTSAGTGLGVLAEAINKFSDVTGVRAKATVQSTGSGSVAAGNVTGLSINGTTIGTVNDVKANDSDGKLVNAINAVTAQTGVEASVDNQGRINLTSLDGRGIYSKGLSGAVGALQGVGGKVNFGRLTITRLGAGDILITAGTGVTKLSFTATAKEYTSNLRGIAGSLSAAALAGGAAANKVQSGGLSKFGAGVTTRAGAMMVMDIAEAAIKQLDKIRANLGSTSNQLTSTINNISVTQVNVASAESQIRDVDFAQESAEFSKRNILAQSGSYAMSQANAMQQNVLRLLQ